MQRDASTTTRNDDDPFEASPGILRWVEAERDASPLFSDWCLPDSGINIRGGFASMRFPDASAAPVRVVVKRLSPRQAHAALAADRLKRALPLGTPCIGSFVTRMRFLDPVRLHRGLGNGATKRVELRAELDTYLVQRFVDDAPTLREYVRDNHGASDAEVRHLWLPPEDEDRGLLIEFAACCCHRLVLGITDPGPANFLVRELEGTWEDDGSDRPRRRLYSLDEASAFSAELAPGTGKTWLAANLGRSKGRASAFDRLRPLLPFVAALGARWRSAEANARVRQELRASLGESLRERAAAWGDYVAGNALTLERDFAALAGIPPALPLPPATIKEKEEEAPEAEEEGEEEPPKKKSKKTSAAAKKNKKQTKAPRPVPPPAPLSPDRPHLFGRADLREVYKAMSVGREGQRFRMRELKSLLQKAIRRNLKPLAHAAAALMLGSHQVTNLCNRLLTISTEDISLGCLEVWKAAAALADLKQSLYSSKKAQYRLADGRTLVEAARWRDELRNSEPFRARLHALVDAMCEAPKTRLCDYLSMTCISPGQQESAGKPVPALDQEALHRLALEARRDPQGVEPALFRFLGRHLGPTNDARTENNVWCALRVALALARSDEHRHAVRACDTAIRVRNETATEKFAGKTALAAAFLLCTRPLDQIDPPSPLPAPPAPSDPTLRALYADVIAGRNLPRQPLPDWVHDKHTGYRGPDAEQRFVTTEEAGLQPRARADLGTRYQEALALAVRKDRAAGAK